jgi:hypothetical protein
LDLIDAGIVDLSWMKVEEYDLDHIQDAMERATVEKGESSSVLVFDKGDPPLYSSGSLMDLNHSPSPSLTRSSPEQQHA